MAVPSPLTWCRCESTLWCLLPRWVAQCAYASGCRAACCPQLCRCPQLGTTLAPMAPVIVSPCPHPDAREATELVLVVRKGGWHKRGLVHCRLLPAPGCQWREFGCKGHSLCSALLSPCRQGQDGQGPTCTHQGTCQAHCGARTTER